MKPNIVSGATTLRHPLDAWPLGELELAFPILFQELRRTRPPLPSRRGSDRITAPGNLSTERFRPRTRSGRPRPHFLPFSRSNDRLAVCSLMRLRYSFRPRLLLVHHHQGSLNDSGMHKDILPQALTKTHPLLSHILQYLPYGLLIGAQRKR